MGDPDCCRVLADRIELRVRVSPGASKNEVRGVREGELWVRIAAAPEKGRANAELVRYLAGLLGLPRAGLRVVAGESSRHKTLALDRAALGALRALLRPAAAG